MVYNDDFDDYEYDYEDDYERSEHELRHSPDTLNNNVKSNNCKKFVVAIYKRITSEELTRFIVNAQSTEQAMFILKHSSYGWVCNDDDFIVRCLGYIKENKDNDLYEKIMRNISKVVKRVLNENLY